MSERSIKFGTFTFPHVQHVAEIKKRGFVEKFIPDRSIAYRKDIGGYGRSWRLSGWTDDYSERIYRKKITIDHTKVPGTLSNFPVLVYRAADADLASKAQSDGDDIYFTSDDGETKLKHEIERYVSGTGQLVAWVKVPSVSSSVDTVIYMYYGDPYSANQENVTDVWDTDFAFVSHMKDDPDSSHVKDSTVNAHNGDKKAAGEPVEADGQVGKAQSGDDSDDYVKVNYRYQITQAITVEVWVKLVTQQANWKGICRKAEAASNFGLVKDADHKARGQIWTGGGEHFSQTGPVLAAGTMYHVVMTYDRFYIRLYVDGDEVTLAAAWTDPIDDSDVPFYIGCSSPTIGEYVNAVEDEVRLSSICRSANWIKTCYNNQKNPTTFISVAAEEPASDKVQIRDLADGIVRALDLDNQGPTKNCIMLDPNFAEDVDRYGRLGYTVTLMEQSNP